MTGRDSYKGIPKKVALHVNKDGSVDMPHPHPHQDGSGAHKVIVTGSGTLVNGYKLVTDENISWHTMAFVSSVSGSVTTDLHYALDPVNHRMHVSCGASNQKFTYILINPGLGTGKL